MRESHARELRGRAPRTAMRTRGRLDYQAVPHVAAKPGQRQVMFHIRLFQAENGMTSPV